ncbi:glycosyltransferase family 2 protein [Flavisolibacter tropicus]|uniref:Glycosyltransferase 2-like domain-containing protein n=1 Tax=Flavisolibacter tropicus TaxID=1492898 RepID=A0A172TQB5_9BACT|nr:glycosyltransferase [Flavisolibacter tropicus]ANE49259.1 hypothetical protein SY85_00810 [Flavisolibacter tropicus]
MLKVSVVIPVYGQWHLVKRNVDSLLALDGNNIEEIIIVNDCSKESNPYKFDSPLVKIISNENNLGYTGTVNKGLKIAAAQIVVLLDSDAFPIEPFIQRLTTFYSSSSVGCVGFSTVDEDGRDNGNYQFEPSITGLVIGQALAHKLRFLPFYKKKYFLPNSCAVSFHKSCLEELGYFDAVNFPVLEADVDLCMRIHRSKWDLIFTKDIVICHKGGNSYKINYKRVLLYHKSRWILLKKFNLILFPKLSKVLLNIRVRVELYVLCLLALFKEDAIDLDEKKYGRRILLKEINNYK